MDQSQTILLYQPMLQAIAYSMVGSLEDAEDIVQDTFMKWLTIDQEKIQNTKAYLIKTVTNNCINYLNAFRKKKQACLDALQISELADKYRETEFAKLDLEKEMAAALAVLHKKLEPVERGVFLLREIFNFEYEDIQDIFGKKKDNCRKLFSRAKEKLDQKDPQGKTDIFPQFQFLESFKNACTVGHFSDFIGQLVQDITGNNKK